MVLRMGRLGLAPRIASGKASRVLDAGDSNGALGMAQATPTPFPDLANRLCIVTQSDQLRPEGALQLRAAFTSVGIYPSLRVDGSLKPNEFMLVVGTRR